jgi:hypothetical protein
MLTQNIEVCWGSIPSSTARAARELVAEELARLRDDQAADMGRSRVKDAVEPPPELEFDESLPPEIPPGIEDPAPRERTDVVEVSAKFLAELRRDYGQGRPTDEGRRLGDLPEVAVWLESLEPGKVKPRADPP